MSEYRDEYYNCEPELEQAILVGLDQGDAEWPVSESLAELERLAQTDGAEVIATMVQKLSRPVGRTFIGTGKAEELKAMVERMGCDVVIFDDELTPSQQTNLEEILGDDVKILDRTALILDIFAQHATTKEGRLQVQLAQLSYVLPRLRGMWSHLVTEQARGGIGGRFGAGESQLEIDRRQIRKRISALNADLKKLDQQRDTQAKSRRISGVFSVALAGYTNAGKSTLLNTLSESDVYVKDELFATLDPTTRSINLEEGRKVCITDTVGFIQKLPHTLVKAFNSTLSEVKSADLLLKVVDATDANKFKELNAVNHVLKQIGADHIPFFVVFNKCDLLDSEQLENLMLTNPDAIFISALKDEGCDHLMRKIAGFASQDDVLLSCLIPFDKGNLVHVLHERAQVIREQYLPEGLQVTARIPKDMVAGFQPYGIEDPAK